MAITVKHKFVSTIPDDPDATLIRPSNWNDTHDLTGTVPVANGGTGAATASDGLNNLLPSQTGNNGKVLATDGTNASWTTNGSGDVVGPASATGNAIARFDGTTGKLIQNSGVTVDDNSNITTNAVFEGFSNTAAIGTQIVLTVASVPSYVITGSGGQTIKLPDATTLPNGTTFAFNNNQSSGAITVNNNSNTLIVSIPSGAFTIVTLLSNSIAAGSWDTHDQAPANVSWSTNTFSYAGSFTNGTWNGNAVAYNRGGTGQSAAFVAGGIVYGSTTTALAVTAIGTTGQVLTSAGAGTPTWTTPTTGTVTSITAGTGLSGGTITSTGTIAIDSTVATLTGTQTLTNKRINPRVSSTTSTATLTVNSDSFDQAVLTAQAVALSVAAPTGTPVNGQKLTLRFKDNATAQTISWTTTSGGFRVIGCTLPTTTVISKTVYIGCIYNSDDTFWDVVSVGQQI